MSIIDPIRRTGRLRSARRPRQHRRAALASGILAFATLAGACGGGAEATAPTIPSVEEPEPAQATAATPAEDIDPEEAMRRYDQCLTEHGIDLPEPDGDGVVVFGEAVGDADGSSGFQEFDAAMEACGPILEEAFGEFELDPEQAAEFADQELEFARCMRENGVVDWPDPTGDPGAVMTMEFEGDLNQDDLNAALSTCTGLVYDGSGGGAGGFSVVGP